MMIMVIIITIIINFLLLTDIMVIAVYFVTVKYGIHYSHCCFCLTVKADNWIKMSIVFVG